MRNCKGTNFKCLWQRRFTPSSKTPLSRNVSLIVELDNGKKFIFTMYAKGVGNLDTDCGAARRKAEAMDPPKVSYCPRQKEKLNKFIGQKLAEAIGDQGLNENLNEQESGDYMDSEKAYQLVDYAAKNEARIFLGSRLIRQIKNWAKEPENKDKVDKNALKILSPDEDHYDHFHVRLKGAKGGGSSGDQPDSEEIEVGDPEDFKTYKKSDKMQLKRTIRTPGTTLFGKLPILRMKI